MRGKSGHCRVAQRVKSRREIAEAKFLPMLAQLNIEGGPIHAIDGAKDPILRRVTRYGSRRIYSARTI